MAVISTRSVPDKALPAGRDQTARQRRARTAALVLIGLVAAALPLVGFASLLLRSQLDPHIENYRLHFVVFGIVGAVAFGLGYTAGEAANRRGDARVLLLSLAFMATGGFLWLHAMGTQSVLFPQEHSGFQVAIPVGLLVAAVFAAGSAFVDVRPDVGSALIRRRTLMRVAVLVAMAAWFVWSVADLPPFGVSDDEAATSYFLTAIAMPARSSTRSVPLGTRASSESPEPPSRGRRCLLRPARGGDGRRRRHRRTQVARELVGMARPDRRGIPRRRARRSPGVAGRAIPPSLPADHTCAPPGCERALRRPRRLHGLRGAFVVGRRPPACSMRTGAWPRRSSPGISAATSRSSRATA